MLREDTDDLEQGIFVYFSSQQKKCRKLAWGGHTVWGGRASSTGSRLGRSQGVPRPAKIKADPRNNILLFFSDSLKIPHLDTETVSRKKTRSPGSEKSLVHSRRCGREAPTKGPASSGNLPPPPCAHRPWLLEGLKCTFLPAEASDTLTKESVRWSFGGDLGRGCESLGSAEVWTDTAGTNPKDAT